MDGFIVIYEPLIDKNITKMLVIANMNITKGPKNLPLCKSANNLSA